MTPALVAALLPKTAAQPAGATGVAHTGAADFLAALNSALLGGASQTSSGEGDPSNLVSLIQMPTAGPRKTKDAAAQDAALAGLNAAAAQQSVHPYQSAPVTPIDLPALRTALAPQINVGAETPALPAVLPKPANTRLKQPEADASARTPSPVLRSALLQKQKSAPVSADAVVANPMPSAAAPAPQTDLVKQGASGTNAQPLQARSAGAQTAKPQQAQITSADVLAQHPAAPAQAATAKTEMTAKTQTKLATALAKAATAAPVPTDNSAAAQAAVVAATAAAVQTQAAPTSTAASKAQAGQFLTKVERAAVANTSNQAMHAPVQPAKVEAQALPIDAGTQAAKPDVKNAEPQTGDGEKHNDQQGRERTAAASAASAMTPKIADAQPAQPAQPVTQQAATHSTAPAATTANMAVAPGAAAAVSTPATATLQVMQQPQAVAQPNLPQLAVSIAAKSKNGEKQFDIKMEPAELGRVEVRLSTDASGKTQAHVVADKPHTLELLQNDKSTLERSLKDAGLDLSNNGLNFSLKSQQQPTTPTMVARSRALSISAVQSTDSVSTTSSSSVASGDARLDIRV